MLAFLKSRRVACAPKILKSCFTLPRNWPASFADKDYPTDRRDGRDGGLQHQQLLHQQHQTQHKQQPQPQHPQEQQQQEHHAQQQQQRHQQKQQKQQLTIIDDRYMLLLYK